MSSINKDNFYAFRGSIKSKNPYIAASVLERGNHVQFKIDYHLKAVNYISSEGERF